MTILELFKFNKVCQHSKVRPDVDFAYCPDCGELIENQWYLVRCACCGVKIKGVIKNGEIIPERNFCHNCGTKDFIIERINKINADELDDFINIMQDTDRIKDNLEEFLATELCSSCKSCCKS